MTALSAERLAGIRDRIAQSRLTPFFGDPRPLTRSDYTTVNVGDLTDLLDEVERLRGVVEAFVGHRDVRYPDRFKATPTDNYVAGFRAAQTDLRAALAALDAENRAIAGLAGLLERVEAGRG